jgi:hypothetical protein
MTVLGKSNRGLDCPHMARERRFPAELPAIIGYDSDWTYSGRSKRPADAE